MRVDYQKILEETFAFEAEYLEENMTLVAGMDEVGRGPLAGPVVSVCAVMDKSKPVVGVRDSKKVSEKKRNELFPIIEQATIEYSVSFVDNTVIDEINILNATRRAFHTAMADLSCKPDFIFIDQIDGLSVPHSHVIIPKGDAKSYCIGCASILAKVLRDNYMIEMHEKYPEYNFASNKGYGSKEHIEAIKKYGPCPIHRSSFIRNFV